MIRRTEATKTAGYLFWAPIVALVTDERGVDEGIETFHRKSPEDRFQTLSHSCFFFSDT